MIVPFAYLKGTSETQYLHYIAKDIYGFLRNNKEDIAEVLAVGFDVANYVNDDGTQPFVDFTREEAKKLYIKIINVIQEPQWTLNDVMHAVKASCPVYADSDVHDRETRYRIERVARTELNRILFYVKEQVALEDGALDYYYGWRGPLDKRTTPMCRFMQTGELTGETIKGEPYDYEYLRSELPVWREEGWALPELKECVRQVHDVFQKHGLVNTDMITDWQMHINCRHTFAQLGKMPREEAEDIQIVDNWIMPPSNEPKPQPEPQTPNIPIPQPEFPSQEERDEINPMHVDVFGDEIIDALGEDEIIINEVPYAERAFGFNHPFAPHPSFFLPLSTEHDDDPIFVFDTINEYDLGTWLRFIVEELAEDMDESIIVRVMVEESRMTNDEISYIMKHWTWLYDLASYMGWIY